MRDAATAEWCGWSRGFPRALATPIPPTHDRFANDFMLAPSPETELADSELFARVAAGDTEAFATFYDRHSGLLFAVALKVLGDGHDAEDVLQEAAVLLWERAPQYDPQLGNPVSWAVTLTRNKAIDRLRSLRRRFELTESASREPQVEPPRESAAIREINAAEDSQAVQRALTALPTEQRRAIELAFFGGLTQQEVAARLQQPLGTIKARIRRGMIALRNLLETES